MFHQEGYGEARSAKVEPMAGIEPATDGLRNRCSTTELHWLKPSETYFGRVRVNGKPIRRSLETRVLSVAKLKLSNSINICRTCTTDGRAGRVAATQNAVGAPVPSVGHDR